MSPWTIPRALHMLTTLRDSILARTQNHRFSLSNAPRLRSFQATGAPTRSRLVLAATMAHGGDFWVYACVRAMVRTTVCGSP